MDLFGLKEHEQRHKDLERHVRRLVEEVSQLTIDLATTRVELRKLALAVEGKVGADEIDPALVALNEGIKRARVQLNEAQDAAEESWNDLSDQLDEALQELREEWAERSGRSGESAD